MPSWVVMGFQDVNSFIMMELFNLHDYVMIIMLSIIIMILYILLNIFSSKFFYLNLSEGTLIETVWSIIPALMLIILVLPSMKVLYFAEDVKHSIVSYKVIGHQWYWTYISPMYKNLFFFKNMKFFYSMEEDSFMYYKDLQFPRLLNSNNFLVLPYGVSSRLMITSFDVIHSFAVPSLGLKVDALPGRINQLYCSPTRIGFYYGQCSEICGSNHSFMPISIYICSLNLYDTLLYMNNLSFMKI